MHAPLTFARHFARLVHLLRAGGTSADEQLATLRGLVGASKAAAVRLEARDRGLFANGMPIPEHFIGANALFDVLATHSVRELECDQYANPADLLGLAHQLARAPVVENGPGSLDARLELLGVESVRLRIRTAAEFDGRDEAAIAAGVMDPMSILLSTLGLPAHEPRPADGAGGAAPAGLVRDMEADELFHSFSAVGATKDSMERQFEKLDAATLPADIAHELDQLVRLATEAVRSKDNMIVADILHGLVTRERELTEAAVRRLYGLVIRRLANPAMLSCVASLLPRDRARYDDYMAIIARAEELGAEALVDALSSADSIGDRRIFFDSLVRLNSGVRTLIFMLADERWYVARNVADLLGEMRVAEAETALTQLMDHGDDRVRIAAANALAKLGTASAVKALRLALRDASPEVRERAAEALGNAKRQRSAAVLIKALEAETNARVQLVMIGALGQLRTSDAVHKLIDIAQMDARSPSVKKRVLPLRVAAVHALGEARTPAAMAAIQGLMQDKEKEVRGAAAWELLAGESGRRRGGGGGVP